MPRTPRLLLSKSYYHIMTRGNNRNIVFKSVENYKYYLKLIKKYKSEHPFDLYHYCFMPSHVHLLVKTNKSSDFSTFMKKINLAYFHHYQQNYGWVGHFWQDRYKSQTVGKDNHFIQCGKYIELNPVRANLAKSPEDYQYSSYNYYAKGSKNDLITRDFIFQDMGNDDFTRQSNYRKMIIDELVLSNYTKSIWGSDYQRYQERKKQRYHI